MECPLCGSKEIEKVIPQFSSGNKTENLETVEKRLQQAYTEIKTDLQEHKKEIKEKDWTK